MFDLCCFSFISSLQILQIQRYPQANFGETIQDIFGVVTPDGPIIAILASFLGLSTGLISNPMGADNTGEQLSLLLEHFNISTTVKHHQHGLSTPSTVVLCDQQENRTWFSFLPMVAENLLSADLEMMNVSHLTYIDFYKVIKEASRRAIDYASQNTIPLFINLGGDALEKQDVLLLRNSNASIVQTNTDLTTRQAAEDYVKELQDLIQPKITIVTQAQRGLVCATEKEVLYVPAYKISTIHSNGAGAAFSAGFAYAYRMKWDINKSLLFASALGGLYCTVKNGFGRFTAADILNFIEEHKETKA